MNERVIQEITDFIFMEDAPQKCDLILIPGSAISAPAEGAAELYRQGFARYVMPSGKFFHLLDRFPAGEIDNPRYYGEYQTEFDYMKHILMANGVPESAILREDRATNTVQNGMFSAEAAAAAGLTVKKAVICCKGFHARRAYLSYACFFRDTELFVSPVQMPSLSRDDWFLSDEGYQTVLGEIAKCGSYFQSMRVYLG